jgi:hypothetical protein
MAHDTWHMAHVGDMRCSYTVGTTEGKNHLEDLDVDVRTLKTELQELGCGSMNSCECGNKSLGSIKCEKYLE